MRRLMNPYSPPDPQEDDSAHDETDVREEKSEETYRPEIQTDPDHKISVLGPTLVFKGELSAGEDLLIQGRIEGTIKHNERNLTVGPQGTVKANIRAKNIIVEGTVRGDMFGAETVTIRETANVRGNIVSPRVGLRQGAKFKGKIDMDSDPAEASKGLTSSKLAKPAKAAKTAKADDTLSEGEVNEMLN